MSKILNDNKFAIAAAGAGGVLLGGGLVAAGTSPSLSPPTKNKETNNEMEIGKPYNVVRADIDKNGNLVQTHLSGDNNMNCEQHCGYFPDKDPSGCINDKTTCPGDQCKKFCRKKCAHKGNKKCFDANGIIFDALKPSLKCDTHCGHHLDSHTGKHSCSNKKDKCPGDNCKEWCTKQCAYMRLDNPPRMECIDKEEITWDQFKDTVDCSKSCVYNKDMTRPACINN